ncbi:DCC1-like thiol-disulfide oxidoreductase family protein [Paenibacillus sp. CN-4]|uniref:DCC1-like thiol-disulfide oxidoreductase family protein n=1 Tax=Paenibacillus nanchangensis TaxID=3348343 RepID=UPI00397B29D9
MWNGLKRGLYERMEPAFPLALFRIGFAVCLLLELGQMMIFRELIFQDKSLVSREGWLLTVIFILWTGALLLILAGYKLRIAAAVNYAVSVYMLGFVTVNEANNWQVDSLFLTGSFLLLFMPASAALSVDRLLEHRREARVRVRKLLRPKARFIHTAFLILTIGLFYLDSILYKLSSSMYLSGLGLWAPASLPFTTYWDISWLIEHEWLMRIMGYTLLVYETLYIFLIWFRKLRTPLSLAGIALHAGILVVFPIPVISFLVIVIHLAIIPDEAYAKLYGKVIAAKRKKLAVYYDRLCPLCRQTVGILSALDFRKAIEWKALQDYAEGEPLLKAIPEADLLHDIYAVEKNAKLHKGVDTYAAILRAMGWTYPAGLLLGLPPVHGIAARIYGRIAAKRKREGGCTDSTCGIGISPLPEKKEGRFAGRFLPAGLLLVFWVVSFIIISFGSPAYAKYLTGENTSTTKTLKDMAAVYKRVVYPVFGWTNHGVYTEIHFGEYNVQTRLVHKQDGREKSLPVIDRDGFAGRYIIGRQWDNWTYATVHPETAYAQAEKHLLAYASYWLKRHGGGMDGGTIEIQVRRIGVSIDTFHPGLLKSNLDEKWMPAGRIEGPLGQLELTLANEAAAEPATWREAVMQPLDKSASAAPAQTPANNTSADSEPAVNASADSETDDMALADSEPVGSK